MVKDCNEGWVRGGAEGGGGAQEAGQHTCENQLPNYVCICICARMQREWLCSILYERILCSVRTLLHWEEWGCSAVTVGK